MVKQYVSYPLRGHLVSVRQWCVRVGSQDWHVQTDGSGSNCVATPCDGSCMVNLPTSIGQEALQVINGLMRSAVVPVVVKEIRSIGTIGDTAPGQ